MFYRASFFCYFKLDIDKILKCNLSLISSVLDEKCVFAVVLVIFQFGVLGFEAFDELTANLSCLRAVNDCDFAGWLLLVGDAKPNSFHFLRSLEERIVKPEIQ